MKNLNSLLFYLTTTIIITLLASLHFLPIEKIVSYSIVWISASILFLLFAFFLSRQNLSSKTIFYFIAVGVLVRLSFINTSPIGSDDIYRYIWDGKIQNAGINPYLYKPTDNNLKSLHSSVLPDKMNFKEMKTIYFPLSQWLFYSGYKLSGENYWGYKLLLLVFELMTFYALYILLKELNIELKNILLYVLCPLPIIQFAVDAHLDGFGLPILLLAIYYYTKEKKTLSAILLGLSFSIKPVGIIMIPVFFLAEKNFKDRLKFLFIPFIAFGFQFIPYIFTTNPFEAFLIYTKNWFYNGLVFNFLNHFIHNNQTSRMICSGMLFILVLPIYFSKKKWEDKIYYSLIMLMIFSPVVHPWYIAWVAIFISLNQKWSAIVFTAACSLTSFTLINYISTGVWKDYWLVQLVEYISLIIFICLEFFPQSQNRLYKLIRQPVEN